MDKSREIIKVQSLLKVPVSDLIFKPIIGMVEIISDNISIGEIPFYNLAGILNYGTDTATVNWLKWWDIYQQNVAQINNQVVEFFGTDEIIITVGKFRKLYIRITGNPNIFAVICTFNENWTVINE